MASLDEKSQDNENMVSNQDEGELSADDVSSDETIEPDEVVVEKTVGKGQPTVKIGVTEPKKVKKKMGRPRLTEQEKLAKRVIVKEKVIYMVQNADGDFEKVKRPILSKTELKKAEREKARVDQEVELGKKLAARKNGVVDKRSANKRTAAQIAATQRMVSANKARKAARDAEKEAKTKKIVKESLKEVVSEPVEPTPPPEKPFYEPKPTAAPAAPPVKDDPYKNMIF
jgi:ParB-like chromosome segregation protein Spo0J